MLEKLCFISTLWTSHKRFWYSDCFFVFYYFCHFYKGNNFCSMLFAFLYNIAFLIKGLSSPENDRNTYRNTWYIDFLKISSYSLDKNYAIIQMENVMIQKDWFSEKKWLFCCQQTLSSNLLTNCVPASSFLHWHWRDHENVSNTLTWPTNT